MSQNKGKKPVPMKGIHPKVVKSSTPTGTKVNDTMMSLDMSKISNISSMPGSGRKRLFTSIKKQEDCEASNQEAENAYNEYLLEVANNVIAKREHEQSSTSIREQLTSLATRLETDRATLQTMERRLADINFTNVKTSLFDKVNLEKLKATLEPAVFPTERVAADVEPKLDQLEVRNVHIADITPGIREFNETLQDTVRVLDQLQGHDDLSSTADQMNNMATKIGPLKDQHTRIANCLSTFNGTVLQEAMLRASFKEE